MNGAGLTVALIVLNGVLLIGLGYLTLRRVSIERSLSRAVDAATGELKGKAGEKIQTLTFHEQQSVELNRKRAELSRTQKRILILETEIKRMQTVDCVVVHALGEPSRDQQLFTCTLLPNPFAERSQKLSGILEQADHVAFITAENDASAKRILQVQYPDRGPMRHLGVEAVIQRRSAS